MKKIVVLLVAVLCAAPAFAGDKGIIKLSLWDNISVAVPNNTEDVRGLSLGIGSKVDSLYGYQWDLVRNHSEEMRGIQSAWIYNTSKVLWGAQGAAVTINRREFIGLQGGFVNLAYGTLTGAQLGFYNQVEDLHGAQVGLVNNAHHISKGLQVGLVNIAKNGWFPVMVLVNGRF